MRPRAMCALFGAIGLGLAFGSATAVSADDAKGPPAKAPDFSKYTFVNDVMGEVVKADEDKVTVKVTYLAPGRPNPNPRARPAAPTQKSMEFEYQFIPDMTLVRFQTRSLLPPKTDDKGKKLAYTEKELDALKKPSPVTGYAASTSDLAKGAMVTVRLVREKSIPADKATDADLRVRLVIITANPPAVPVTNKP